VSDLAFRSGCDLAALIRSREVGCAELLCHFLDRVEKYNPALNAVICLDPRSALERARAADAALARGDVWGPLHGLPITVKEAFDVAGMPTTWGVERWKRNIAECDAAAVQRLQDAGAIVFGKTNVPTMLADWQTHNPIHGTTRNPWDLARTPGGSSGGAAAALAAGLTSLELGSDIAGSIRGPAHYCGIYGHKPTYGVISLEGHALPGRSGSPDLIVGGPMARSAVDLALTLAILAGPTSTASAAWRLELPPAGRPVDHCRVAVLPSHSTAEVDVAVQEAIVDLGRWLESRGLQVDFDARPGFDYDEAHDCFILLLRAATSVGLDAETLEAAAATARRFAPQDRAYPALQARGNSLRHSDWLKLDEFRQAIRQSWRRFFAEFDLLLCPAATSTAFPHNQQGERWERVLTVNGRPQPSTTQMFWSGFSGMAYLPSTVVPIALSPEGLPIGVQIVGPEFGDLRCLEFARYLEETHRGFVPPPGYGQDGGVPS
jgi:amidase